MLNARRITCRIPSADLPWIAAWWIGFSLWHLVAILCFARRISGAFWQPLSSGGLLGCAVVICGASAVWRLSPERLQYGINQTSRQLIRGAPSLASLLLIGSVTLGGSSLSAAILACSAVVATETFWLTRFLSNGQSTVPRPGGVTSGVEMAGPEEPSAAAMNTHIVDDPPQAVDWDSESLPAGVTQQFLRTEQEQGETWSGLLRVDFPPGERLRVVHVPFYPPFAKVPEVQISQATGPTISVKVTQVESFGVRFELRSQPSGTDSLTPERFSVVIELEATTTALDDPRVENSET